MLPPFIYHTDSVALTVTVTVSEDQNSVRCPLRASLLAVKLLDVAVDIAEEVHIRGLLILRVLHQHVVESCAP